MHNYNETSINYNSPSFRKVTESDNVSHADNIRKIAFRRININTVLLSSCFQFDN